MDISDGMDKSWDHPWTTEEMRKKRGEWSLAADSGLLQHLQQFSENLVTRANKTEEALDSFTSQLNETAILIDNVTNTSLALANTQFIESRVQEDDIEIEQKVGTSVQDSTNEDLATADLIASVSESIKQGLSIMDKKYKKMEFVDSDSEEEDNKVVLSVVLGPNDPYQDRPLPYVIGSEKWTNSSKIGLESSSSSESEQVDDEEDSESHDDRAVLREYNMNTALKTNVVELSPSLIDSDYSKQSDISYMDNDKLDVISQNNIHSASKSITPNDNVSKMPFASDSAPTFAEELAKRLGTIRQAQKPVIVDDKSEASINRFKDDLLTPEADENVLNDKSRSIFSGNSFLNDQSSENLWKEKPIEPYKNNIIPASIDVPPPISTVSTKPKSEIDDLFADADSEDSDNIFSSKNTVKTIAKNKYTNSNNHLVNTESAQKKYLGTVAPAVTSQRATSTPETNVNDTNLFSDDEDDGDLFGSSKNQPPYKIKPVGALIRGNILASNIQNKLSNKIPRTQSSGSSGSDTPSNYENSREPLRDHSRNIISNNNNINDRSSIVIARNNAENLTTTNESSSSSGISIHPSINITGGSSMDVDFQPQMTSTRLKSEEIYRERVVSDSLFTAGTRNSVNTTSTSSPGNQPQEEQNEDVSLTQQDDVFENEDLFGPPPLPKANSKPVKSKTHSLFDDSDSGDELFSTTSSGSRSQKSTDFLTSVSQHPDKSRFTERRSLFDENIDIFGTKDSPDVDIFGIASKSSKNENNFPGRKYPDSLGDSLFASNVRVTMPGSNNNNNNNTDKRPSIAPKKNSLFDDNEDIDDGDLFAARPIRNKARIPSRVPGDHDNNDLFSAKNVILDKRANAKQSTETTVTGTGNVDRDTLVRKTERKGSDILAGNGLFSSTIGSNKLIFEDDDYDELFGGKAANTDKSKESTPGMKVDAKVEGTSVKNAEASIDSDIFADDREPSAVSTVSSNKEEQRGEKDASRPTPDELNVAQNVETKKCPPKSLNIQITTSSLSPTEENSLTGRRTVSGKIKNLMGKVGDLKILSPMDTPPLWRRSEEKTDEEDSVADRDSDDGGCISTQGHSSPPSVSEDSTAQKQSSLQSTVSGESNVESAISFDEPAQVETLSIAASKTRVRIQAKRRPQSRHARKSALRQSGIDFDTVDASGNNLQDEGHGNRSSSNLKEPFGSANANTSHIFAANSDRLASSVNDNVHRLGDPNMSLAVDDKSELGSISKESSMSANKNTLLSPSTDEEDLFDVPPDLPEDPQKEDTLFGRAPILSPVEGVLSEKTPVNFEPLNDTRIKRIDNTDTTSEKSIPSDKNSKFNALTESNKDTNISTTDPCKKEYEPDDIESKDELKEMVDPLRDSNHDPLKDPSQLFAFVTKTPSPEKGKSLLFSEDDSLFSSGIKKPPEEQTAKKPVLDLFADDTDGDLFSASLSKPVKKPSKDTKLSLFDDDGQDDEDDNLFGSVMKKSSVKIESEKKYSLQQPKKKISLFDDSDDTNLFSEQSEQQQKSESGSVKERPNKNEFVSSITEPVKTSDIRDIFAKQSSGKDDIFATKSIPKKVDPSKSLFLSDDEDDSNIFGKKSSMSEPRVKPIETRSTTKKLVTRDLKKTVEKIGKDPLSILQDD